MHSPLPLNKLFFILGSTCVIIWFWKLFYLIQSMKIMVQEGILYQQSACKVCSFILVNTAFVLYICPKWNEMQQENGITEPTYFPA